MQNNLFGFSIFSLQRTREGQVCPFGPGVLYESKNEKPAWLNIMITPKGYHNIDGIHRGIAPLDGFSFFDSYSTPGPKRTNMSFEVPLEFVAN